MHQLPHARRAAPDPDAGRNFAAQRQIPLGKALPILFSLLRRKRTQIQPHALLQRTALVQPRQLH